MQHPIQTALRNMPVADALTIIAQYANDELSEMIGGDLIFQGVQSCLEEIAAEDQRDCWGFESDVRAYRAMQAGVGA